MHALENTAIQQGLATRMLSGVEATATVSVSKDALKAAALLLAQGKNEAEVRNAVDLIFGDGAFAKVLAYQDEEKDRVVEQATAQARVTFQARVKESTLVTMPPEEMRGYRLIVEYPKDAPDLAHPNVSIVKMKASGSNGNGSGSATGNGNGGAGSKGSIVKLENPGIGPAATFEFPEPTSYRKLNVFLSKVASENGWTIGDQADCEYAPHFRSKFGAHGWLVTLADGTTVSA